MNTTRLPVGTDSRILGYYEGSLSAQFEDRGGWGGLYHCSDFHRPSQIDGM